MTTKNDYSYLWKSRKIKKKPPKKVSRNGANVYRLFDANGALLYVGCTTVDVAKRLNVHHCRTQSWWPEVARVEQTHYERHEDALLEERRAIWHERPMYNLVHSRTGNIKPEPWNEESRAERRRAADLLDASGIVSPHLVNLSAKIPWGPYIDQVMKERK